MISAERFVRLYMACRRAGLDAGKIAEMAGLDQHGFHMKCSQLRARGVRLPYIRKPYRKRGTSELTKKLNEIIDQLL